MIKISIIIAIYNEEKYIEKCIKSLIQQDYKDFEIIVVDDGSIDSSKFKVQSAKLQLKIKNLELIEQEHRSPAIARNLGVKYAKGDILVFVDGDMEFKNDFLTNLVKPIIEGKAKGTYSLEEYVANWDNGWARCWNYNWNLPDKRRIDSIRSDQVKDFRAILKSEFIKVKGFDDTGYTDTWTLSDKLGYKPIPTNAIYYHNNPGTLKEVFSQAKWVSKRPYKFGILGKTIALFRVNPLFSLIIGIIKAARKKEFSFLVFKVVYDFGFSLGILEIT